MNVGLGGVEFYMEKYKLTNHQLFSLTAGGAFGGAAVVIAAVMASIAKQDAWISALITPLYGVLIIWLIWYLGSQFPGMTYVGIIKKVLGKWIGTLVSIGFILSCFIPACHFPWYIASFYTSEIMPETPPYAVSFLFSTALIIGLLYGIKTIARASELFLFFVSTLLLLSIVLVIPKIEVSNVKPIFENGIVPTLKASLYLSSVLTFPCYLLLMIYPVLITNIKEARKSLIHGYLWASLLVFIIILMCILVLGAALTATSQFPPFKMANEIDIGPIFSRLEFLISTIWIFSDYIIGMLFLYAGIMGLSELLGLVDYKKIVLPFGLIFFVLSGVVIPDVYYASDWLIFGSPLSNATFCLLLPVIILIVSWIKKRLE